MGKLTDLAVKQLTPKEKQYSVSDGGGLSLLVKPNNTKAWRYNYRYGGKQKTLAIGVYPSVGLKDARKEHAKAKKLLDENIDPCQEKKSKKRQTIYEADLAFNNIAKEWWEHQKGTWTEEHAQRVWLRLSDNSFADLGHVLIAKIEPQDVISTIRKIEKRGSLDVAQRVLQDIRRVCRYAVQNGKLKINPASELTAEIIKSRKTSHRPSLPREQLPQFLRDLDTYTKRGRLITFLAIRLLILTFVRSGELRGARWDELDLENKIWRIPSERMKMKAEHIVPLTDQALEVIETLRPITGQYEFLFPSERRRTECMSDNTMRRAIFKLGYDGNTKGKSKCVPHGFRATASSILNETGFNPDAIERQLAHVERNGVRAAYTHHARYLDERKDMMQWWANYLDELKESGKVIPIFSKTN